MIGKTNLAFISKAAMGCVLATMPLAVCNAQSSDRTSGLVQFGAMHEAIGNGQHQGRVSIAKIVGSPHFYGIGALEGLRGEITVMDSMATVTGVTKNGHLQPVKNSGAQATMLVGQSIEEWTVTTLAEEVSHAQFDKTIARMAARKGMDVSKPFVFVIEGEFADVRLHVINGACPVHARIKGLDIEEENRPFELTVAKLKGTLVGVYAADSVGKLTHPATSTHTHIIYVDEKTNKRVTGHIERVGLAKDAVLKLPVFGEESEASAEANRKSP